MKIEDVEELDKQWHEGDFGAADRAIEALRAEAWHPIEKAGKLGAKDGRKLLFWGVGWTEPQRGHWVDYSGWLIDGIGFPLGVTHFRSINPLEGA